MNHKRQIQSIFLLSLSASSLAWEGGHTVRLECINEITISIDMYILQIRAHRDPKYHPHRNFRHLLETSD